MLWLPFQVLPISHIVSETYLFDLVYDEAPAT